MGAHEEAVTMILAASVAFERQGKLMMVQLQTPQVACCKDSHEGESRMLACLQTLTKMSGF